MQLEIFSHLFEPETSYDYQRYTEFSLSVAALLTNLNQQ